MPVDEHACSVSLPTWSAVVGYEEGNPAVVGAMQCGYPRFVYHPYVLQLMKYVLQQHASPKEDVLVLPSIHAARRCQIFLLRALWGDEAGDTPDPALVATSSADQVAAAAALTSAETPIRVVSIQSPRDQSGGGGNAAVDPSFLSPVALAGLEKLKMLPATPAAAGQGQGQVGAGDPNGGGDIQGQVGASRTGSGPSGSR